MPNPRLLAELDGGPHDDPREAEERELLDDGQDEVDARRSKDEDDSKDVSFEDWADDEDGKKKPKPAKAAAIEEEEEPEAEEKAGEKQEDTKDLDLDDDGKVKVNEGEEVKVKPELAAKPIPYERFRKELAKRYGLAASLAEANQRIAALEARTKTVTDAADKAADPQPDPVLDPLAFNAWKVRRLEAEIKAMRSAPQAGAPPVIPQEEIAVLTEVYRESAEEFKADHPDFVQAYQHAVARTGDWIKGAYPQANQGQREAILQQLEMRAVKDALRAGIEPAEAVYNFAVQNGYQSAGSTAPTGAAVQKTTSPAVKERILDAATEAARRARAQSIATTGRTATRRPLTDADIDSMSNAELERFMRRNSGSADPLRA